MIILHFRKLVSDDKKKLKSMGFLQGSLELSQLNTPLAISGLKTEKKNI